MRKVAFVFYALMFFVILSGCSQQEPKFKSPEAVVSYLAKNLKDGNLDNTLKAYVFYDGENIGKINTEHLQNVNLGLFVALPKEYNSLTKINLFSRYTSQLRWFIGSLLLPEDFEEKSKGGSLLLDDTSITELYKSSMNVKNLNGLELIDFVISDPDLQFSKHNESTIKFMKDFYGYDEVVAYDLLYKINNKYYASGITLGKYNKYWYIHDLSSYCSAINLSSSGRAVSVSGTEEFKYRYKSEN